MCAWEWSGWPGSLAAIIGEIHAGEECAGMAPRRSPRDHPPMQESEEGEGLARRHNPRLHPQIQTSQEGAGVTRHSCIRVTSPAEPVSLPVNDDMLREILLRLPPQPSSLHRASAVCRRWRGLVTDPKFVCRFRAHHRKPPLLGVIQHSDQGIVYTPVLNPPDRIPPQRLYLGRYSAGWTYDLLDCHHGRVLVRDWVQKELVVFDPITGQQHGVAVPPGFAMTFLHGAVVCADSNQGHVHGGCHSSPFKVVMVTICKPDNPCLVCVYSSETGLCGNPISTDAPCGIYGKSAVLVGNCLYWLSMSDGIVEFDLDKHSLTVIKGPPVTRDIFYGNRHIIQAEGGALGFSILSYPHFQMWQMNVNGHGVATWVPWKTIEMHTILRLPSQPEGMHVQLLGYDEDDAVFLLVGESVYMVQLKSRQSMRLPGTHHFPYYHPFKSFYIPGTTIAGKSNGAEISHNTEDGFLV